ncbi:MAG: serine hydrolase [Candidatus Jorgensenbacteria bacterium]
MSERWQAIILVSVVLVAVGFTRQGSETASPPAALVTVMPAAVGTSESAPAWNVSFQRASVAESVIGSSPRAPARVWTVPDPTLSAYGVLLYSLDDETALWSKNAAGEWPTASVVKLLTAVTVMENMGGNKKVAVSEAALAAGGDAGGLKSGEVYATQDLLKVMLLSSSNGAAAVFAEAGGGTREFVRVMQEKALKINMIQTHVDDPAGLSTSTISSPDDILRLIRYILGNHPQIFTWSRTPQFLVQPLNDPVSRVVQNINPFVGDARFLGGKTGTLRSVGENFAGVLSFHDRRIAVILLGSADRVGDVNLLLDWASKAYVW